jgi:CRP/FNR family cyclic AMP-dependent transcriptional regulator
MTPQAARTLRSIELFATVPSPALARIEAVCAWRTYQPAEAIVTHLDPSRDVYCLVAGSARVSLYAPNGKQVVFRDAGPGALFGEFSAIDGKPRSAYVEALKPCLVAKMSDKVFLDIIAREPGVALALLRHVIGIARELSGRIFEFSALAVNNRIHAELLRLAGDAHNGGKTATITPAPTHVDIASRISTHREAVTRELNRLAKLGVVKQNRNTLLICDVERLRRIVHDASDEG